LNYNINTSKGGNIFNTNLIYSYMPDPVKAPPQTLVHEFRTKVTLEVSEICKNEPMKKVRRKAQLNEVCNQLAYIRAFLKYNKIEIK